MNHFFNVCVEKSIRKQRWFMLIYRYRSHIKKSESSFLICYLGFQHLVVKLFHADANLKLNEEEKNYVFPYVNKEYLNAISKQIVRKCRVNSDSRCVFVYNSENTREARISIERIEHGTHCVFLDDYWALSRSTFLLIFMKLSYTMSICHHRIAIKKYYIIVHFNERDREKSVFFSYFFFLEINARIPKIRRLPKTILNLQMSSNFTHLLCLYCIEAT